MDAWHARTASDARLSWHRGRQAQRQADTEAGRQTHIGHPAARACQGRCHIITAVTGVLFFN
jgi:hypothetical protein